jgi:class 3 adenylate cyclase
VAAVTFKTFAHEIAVKKIKLATDQDVGCHIGIDQKTVLVKKVGMKRAGGRTDRQNEVWAGKPVNMAAKLASLTDQNELLASDRFVVRLSDARATMSCGCGNKGISNPLWSERDLSGDPRFDFKKAFLLRSIWCAEHGTEYANGLLRIAGA